MANLLEVNNLTVHLKKKKERLLAVSNVSFEIENGKTLGIIGESGSGKSLTCYSIMGLLNKKLWDVEGEVYLDGQKLDIQNNKAMQLIRGNKIALIMQNPMSAFNPVITIGSHFIETINKAGNTKHSSEDIKRKAIELMEKMRIRDPESVYRSYAFQLSGGMLQRVMISLALSVDPDILVADEPTTALDLTVQHEIIKILKDLQEKLNTSILIVSHDLGVISKLADEIAVMYAGVFMERGKADSVLSNPQHPYTKGLFKSRPAFRKDRLYMMPGQPPGLDERGEGCQFFSRCGQSSENCLAYKPSEDELQGTHKIRCMNYRSEFIYKTEQMITHA